MSIALVQEVGGKTTSGGSTTKTITISTPAAGNLLVLMFTPYLAPITVSSVTGGGVTWVLAGTCTNGTLVSRCYYGVNSSGSGTTISVTISNTYVPLHYNISEWSGTDTAPVFDPSISTNSGASGTASSSSVTPTAGKEVLLLALGSTDGSLTNSPTGSFTALTRDASSGSNGYAYRIVASASGSYQTTWANPFTYAWATFIVGFDAAGGGGGGGGPFPFFTSRTMVGGMLLPRGGAI